MQVVRNSRGSEAADRLYSCLLSARLQRVREEGVEASFARPLALSRQLSTPVTSTPVSCQVAAHLLIIDSPKRRASMSFNPVTVIRDGRVCRDFASPQKIKLDVRLAYQHSSHGRCAWKKVNNRHQLSTILVQPPASPSARSTKVLLLLLFTLAQHGDASVVGRVKVSARFTDFEDKANGRRGKWRWTTFCWLLCKFARPGHGI